MIIRFCSKFHKLISKKVIDEKNINFDETIVEVDFEQAKNHIDNCEYCSENISDLIDNFGSILSPAKMVKLIKTIKGK